MPQTKGLIFDLDGTLTLTQQFHFQAFAAVFKKYGMNYTFEEDIKKYSGKGGHYTFPEVFASHGRPITPEQTEQFVQEKKEIYDRIINKSPIDPVPGVKTFLEKIKNRGLPMIIASGNRAESIDLILRKAGIREYFKEFVTNQDVKKPKPNPDIFLKAAEKLNLQPRDCIVFEDAINGVNAARAAGIRCIGITSDIKKERLLTTGADFAVASYDEITDQMLSL